MILDSYCSFVIALDDILEVKGNRRVNHKEIQTPAQVSIPHKERLVQNKLQRRGLTAPRHRHNPVLLLATDLIPIKKAPDPNKIITHRTLRTILQPHRQRLERHKIREEKGHHSVGEEIAVG